MGITRRRLALSAFVIGAFVVLGFGLENSEAGNFGIDATEASRISDAAMQAAIVDVKSVAPGGSGGARDQVSLSALPRDIVRDIQQLLNDYGYNAGPVDGVPGDRTKAAIDDYSADQNLPYQYGFVHTAIVQEADLAGQGGNNAGSKGNSGGGNNAGGGNGGTCGWYAIAQCGQSRSAAQRATNQYGGFVIDTSDPAYPNFRNGFYCVAEGPYSQSDADDVREEMQDAGSRDAYIKNAC